MKAVFEFELPDCCEICTLMYKGPMIEVCAAAKKFPGDALRRKERACFCPLKIAEEKDKAQNVNIGENGTVYCPSCKRKIGAFHGRNYCPDCGQKIDWSDNG